MRFFRPALAFLSLTSLVCAADEAAFRAAVALYTQHRPLEAEKAFEAIEATDPNHGPTQFYLGQLALRRNDPDKAVAHLERAVAISPADSGTHLVLGDAYGTAAQKAGVFSKIGLANKCKAEYQKAVELNPASVDAHFSLMNYYLLAPGFLGGGTDKAMAEALEVKKLDVDRGRFAVSAVYAEDKKFDLAFAEFDAVLKSNPDDYFAGTQIGRLAGTSGLRLDDGVAALRHCLTLPEPPPGIAPNHARVQWRLGTILEKKQDKAGAKAAYEAALALDPNLTRARDSLKKL